MKVVLDTNVLVSGIFFEASPAARMIDLWLKGGLQAYATPQILEEYRRVIERFSLLWEPVLEHDWPSLLPKLCSVLPDEENPRRISRDPTDDKFLFCALHARAEYLVSGDRDLTTLSEEFPFKIVSPGEFLRIL